jgi:SAM-dependent methyltransferase
MIKFLYGKNYTDRFLEILKEMDDRDCTVLDVCSGDCALYKIAFKGNKKIQYKGIDINEVFIREARNKNIDVTFCDVMINEIPKADYVVLQGSLYQFHPNCEMILRKLFDSANKKLIISEPVRNLSSSSSSLISFFSRFSADPGDGHKTYRFNKVSLKQLFEKSFAGLDISVREIPGGRDLILSVVKDKEWSLNET